MNIVVHRVFHRFFVLLLYLCCLSYPVASKAVTESGTGINCENNRPLCDLSTSFQTFDSTFEDPGLAWEQATAVLPDSGRPRTYSLLGIVVTASRVPQTQSYTPSFITILSKSDLESSNGVTLADALAPSVGVFIKDQGSTSALKTISQRGLGSEHTLILLNGLRVSSEQNGLMDLGLLRSDEIESVEILRGGQSALYGADAVAGLINIVTLPKDVHNSVQATASLGSFGYRRYHVTGSLSSGSGDVRLSYGEERSDENFPFQFHNGPLVFNLRRRNSDLLLRYGSIYGETGFGTSTRFAVQGSALSSERGVPGDVVSPFTSGLARQTDKDYVLQALLSSPMAGHAVFHCSGQLHAAYERYRDPDFNINGETVDNYFQNADLRIEPRMDMTLGDALKLGVGSELVRTSTEGNSVSKIIIRHQWGTYVAGEFNAMRSSGIINAVSIFPSLRLDAISVMLPTWSPQMGGLVDFGAFDAGPLQRVRPALRLNASRNFRMPTFNELYFSGGGGFGNPALRPEFSTSLDAGASVNFMLAGEQVVQATYFTNDMTDRIVWVAAGGGNVTPRNLQQVRSRGVEALYRWDLPGKPISFEAHYSRSDTRKTSADFPGDPTADKQLTYVPHETFTLRISAISQLNTAVFKECGGEFTWSFVGYRYVTEDNLDFLPSYAIANVSIRSRLTIDTFSLLARIEVNNLINKDYQVMLSYPMPPRSFRLTMGIEY